jgi:hypothetical protein
MEFYRLAIPLMVFRVSTDSFVIFTPREKLGEPLPGMAGRNGDCGNAIPV